jgi:hypothetical protein
MPCLSCYDMPLSCLSGPVMPQLFLSCRRSVRILAIGMLFSCFLPVTFDPCADPACCYFTEKL